MRERSILVSNSYYNLVSDWALAATDGDEPAAKMINVMLYHFDNRYANRILVELIERAMNKNRKHLRELGDWMPYSIDYLKELLLNCHGNNQVIIGRKKLIEISFISDNVPADIEEFYSKSHSWYKFEIENIKDWINRVWLPTQANPIVFAPNVSEVRKAISDVTGQNGNNGNRNEQQDDPENVETEQVETEPQEPHVMKKPEGEKSKKVATIDQMTNALGKFYIHIHGKTSSYILDKERKSRVKAILKNLIPQVGDRRALTMCAQAIIGNVVSDFHQAKHPDNMLGLLSEKTGNKGRKFDDIGEYIFKTAKKMDGMIGHAEDKGVTEQVALDEFKKFWAGNRSDYSIAVIQEAKKEKIVKEQVSKLASKTDIQKAQNYRNFARDISAFFLTNVPTKEILEMCETNQGLYTLGAGLTDSEALFDALVVSAKHFGSGNISKRTETQMQEFAKKFCELQEYNFK